MNRFSVCPCNPRISLSHQDTSGRQLAPSRKLSRCKEDVFFFVLTFTGPFNRYADKGGNVDVFKYEFDRNRRVNNSTVHSVLWIMFLRQCRMPLSGRLPREKMDSKIGVVGDLARRFRIRRLPQAYVKPLPPYESVKRCFPGRAYSYKRAEVCGRTAQPETDDMANH